MTSYAEILNAALTLPPQERGELAETLLESMDEPAETTDESPEISAAWRDEIARRSAAYIRGEVKGIPWNRFATKCDKSTKAMLEAELLPAAQDDYEESYAWYRKQSVLAADRFEVAIDDAIAKLRSDPSLGIRIDEQHRFYRLKKRFPFYLVYRLEPMKIVIVAVAHNRREPNYWRGR